MFRYVGVDVCLNKELSQIKFEFSYNKEDYRCVENVDFYGKRSAFVKESILKMIGFLSVADRLYL